MVMKVVLHIELSKLWLGCTTINAPQALQWLKPEIHSLLNGQPLTISLKGLQYMNDDPSSMHVLYLQASHRCVYVVAYMYISNDGRSSSARAHVRRQLNLAHSSAGVPCRFLAWYASHHAFGPQFSLRYWVDA